MTMKIAFIGGGNMAQALIAGLQQQAFAMANITVIEPNEEKRNHLAQQHNINVSDTLDQIVASDVIVLAVKPQQLSEVAQSLIPFLTKQLIISIAAGIRIENICQWLNNYPVIVRAMPNTPAKIQAGMTGLFANAGVSEEQKTMATTILKAAGEIIWVDQESLLDAVTAISGSGPAYVFYLIEALQTAAEQLGLDAQTAKSLSISTFKGASMLAEQSSESVTMLKEQVTSKGGTTEQGLQSLEHSAVKAAIIQAAKKAHARAITLGDALGKTK